MRPYLFVGALIAGFLATTIIYLASDSSKPVPPNQPAYALAFQLTVDDVRPKGESRMLVKGCVAGPTGNRHFCSWVYRGQCHAGMIREDPGSGTVPEHVGEATLPPEKCTPVNVLHWLGTQPSTS